MIWVAADTTGLPESVRAVVRVGSTGDPTLQVDHDPPIPLQTETVAMATVEAAARLLAGFEPGGVASPSALPDSVRLADLGIGTGVDEVVAQWAVPRRGLATPLGLVAGGGVLGVDLVADGPHALVAGTTGAGKSELLRSLLASMAALHPPTRVNLLLVDYKGGAAFGPLSTLPHCVGLVTDLDAVQVHRTLTALRAELRQREVLCERHGATELQDLDDEVRPPSLVVVVDEFAALVMEVPAFLDGVVDVAQRGRSLGIHMVLATQRPAGVISDAVRANTSLRIALRLPDADDSIDVVGLPTAATFARAAPGRAVLRLGPDTLVTAQMAWTGAQAGRDTGPRVRHLGATVAPPEPARGHTELGNRRGHIGRRRDSPPRSAAFAGPRAPARAGPARTAPTSRPCRPR